MAHQSAFFYTLYSHVGAYEPTSHTGPSSLHIGAEHTILHHAGVERCTGHAIFHGFTV